MNTGQLGYTIAEAVKATGIGRTTIYADLKAGRLAARKRGKRTIILADDLRAYLASLPPQAGGCVTPCPKQIGAGRRQPPRLRAISLAMTARKLHRQPSIGKRNGSPLGSTFLSIKRR